MLLRGFATGFISSLKIPKKIVATESEGVRNSICCHVHQVKMKVAGVILWSRVGIFMLLNTLKGFSTTPTTSAHTVPKIRIFLNFQSCFPGPLWISGVGKILVETFYLLIAENLLVYVRTHFGEICFSFNERSCECVCVCVCACAEVHTRLNTQSLSNALLENPLAVFPFEVGWKFSNFRPTHFTAPKEIVYACFWHF